MVDDGFRKGSESIDFGELYVGELANEQLTLSNLGLLDLEGQASVDDESGGFSVFPAEILSRPDGEDGITVSFLGSEEGVYETTLQIASNDPAQPTKSITLKATVIPDGQPRSSNGEELTGAKESQVVGGCGCSAANTLPHPFFLLIPLLVLGRRKE